MLLRGEIGPEWPKRALSTCPPRTVGHHPRRRVDYIQAMSFEPTSLLRACSAVLTFTALLLFPALDRAAQADFLTAVSARNRGDYDASFKEFRRLALQGHVRAQFQLGMIYETGQGDFPSEGEAIRWNRMAASQGHPCAQYNLGVRYDKGRGVEQDYRKAVQWYRFAAEQGHADAQLNLGVKYGLGEGVEQDYQQALWWFRLAAKRGSAKALFNMGLLNQNGRVGPRNLLRAYVLYDLSASKGHAPARARLAAVDRELSALQKVEATRLVREWNKEAFPIEPAAGWQCLWPYEPQQKD